MTKTEFQREERYVVFKVSDLGNSLKATKFAGWREYAEQRRLKGKEPLECRGRTGLAGIRPRVGHDRIS